MALQHCSERTCHWCWAEPLMISSAAGQTVFGPKKASGSVAWRFTSRSKTGELQLRDQRKCSQKCGNGIFTQR
ncbi:unnamed protein product, partial [Gulo gulo]